jgi:hypothetical protein
MNISVFMAMTVALSICFPAICQEIEVPQGFAFGLSGGQRAGDLSVGLDVTSPYFHYPWAKENKNTFAIRAGGDMRLKKGVLLDGTRDTMMRYFTARISYVGGFPVSDYLRMYDEIGGMALFPPNDVATSTNPYFGAYGHYGTEVFIGKNAVTKKVSMYFEIGVEVNSGKARLDKLVNSPMIGWGSSACFGGRFYL